MSAILCRRRLKKRSLEGLLKPEKERQRVVVEFDELFLQTHSRVMYTSINLNISVLEHSLLSGSRSSRLSFVDTVSTDNSAEGGHT